MGLPWRHLHEEVRCLQRRPTVVEFTGFLWVFGYFLERGYVSYLFGLPIAFVAMGWFAGRPPDRAAGRGWSC